MKTFLKVLGNSTTRNAMLLTIAILFIYRLGSFIITPGIDSAVILDRQASSTQTIETLFSYFGGGSLAYMSLFALGVSPYITSSIVIQLCESELVPSMKEWKHQGIEGQNKRSRYTRNMALIFAFLQSLAIIIGLSLTSGSFVLTNYFVVALIMTAGTAILIWLADRITEKGVGNGISILIIAGIIAMIPAQVNSVYGLVATLDGTDALLQLLQSFAILVIVIIVIIMVIYYTLAYRQIPINYVRSGKGTVRKNSYLPIKLNPAGVIPVIFAAPIMILTGLLVEWLFTNIISSGGGTAETIFRAMFTLDQDYWIFFVITYSLLILFFSVFYSYIQMNPETMTENLEKQSAYIIGVRPGDDTEVYLSKTIFRVSILGGFALAFIAVLPIIIGSLASVSLGGVLLGTSVIIVVSVIIQVYQGLRNKVENKKYRKLIGEV